MDSCFVLIYFDLIFWSIYSFDSKQINFNSLQFKSNYCISESLAEECGPVNCQSKSTILKRCLSLLRTVNILIMNYICIKLNTAHFQKSNSHMKTTIPNLCLIKKWKVQRINTDHFWVCWSGLMLASKPASSFLAGRSVSFLEYSEMRCALVPVAAADCSSKGRIVSLVECWVCECLCPQCQHRIYTSLKN